MDRRKWNF